MREQVKTCAFEGCNKKFKTATAKRLYCKDRHRVLAARANQNSSRPSDDLTAPEVHFNNKYLLMKTGVTA